MMDVPPRYMWGWGPGLSGMCVCALMQQLMVHCFGQIFFCAQVIHFVLSSFLFTICMCFSGYCGETSIQSAGLFFGNWISEERVCLCFVHLSLISSNAVVLRQSDSCLKLTFLLTHVMLGLC
jgi:hypothetical protein